MWCLRNWVSWTEKVSLEFANLRGHGISLGLGPSGHPRKKSDGEIYVSVSQWVGIVVLGILVPPRNGTVEIVFARTRSICKSFFFVRFPTQDN